MEIIEQVIMVLVPMILSLSVHEWAHAFAAYKLGDDTAAREGRLTLSPLAHIDPIGTLLLPILLTVSGTGFFFGWAKPVPVSPHRFKRTVTMRTGMIITSLAGPASNIVLAFIVAGLAVGLGSHFDADSKTQVAAFSLLQNTFMINLYLAVFNMLPVPPLDGSRLLPDRIQAKMQRYVMFTFVALILIINVAGELVSIPAQFLAMGIAAFWQLIF